jgi:hypothetical protein
MTSRFPAPWRIVEIPRGFAVEDATGLQLGVFYGRSDPNAAGHTGFLTIDEARQMALDFAKLPQLFKRTSARSVVAKAVPHTPQSATLAQNGRYSPKRPERLPGNLALRSEIIKPG